MASPYRFEKRPERSVHVAGNPSVRKVDPIKKPVETLSGRLHQTGRRQSRPRCHAPHAHRYTLSHAVYHVKRHDNPIERVLSRNCPSYGVAQTALSILNPTRTPSHYFFGAEYRLPRPRPEKRPRQVVDYIDRWTHCK